MERIYGPLGQWTDEANRIQCKINAALKPIIEDNAQFDIRDLESVFNDCVSELFLVERITKYDVPVEAKAPVLNTIEAPSYPDRPGLWAVIDNHTSGYDRDKDNVKNLGAIGDSFEVCEVSMGQSRTSIRFVDNPTYYNSVNFTFVKNGRSHDIYNDPEYNPYLNL